MKKKRYSEAEIVAILQEAETAPTKAEVWRKHGISQWCDGWLGHPCA